MVTESEGGAVSCRFWATPAAARVPFARWREIARCWIWSGPSTMCVGVVHEDQYARKLRWLAGL